MKNHILLLISFLIGQVSCTQDRVVERTVLNKYDNGQTMRERVKYLENDTLVEFVYFKNGQIDYKRQILNNRKNGWSYIYNEKGELIFFENYQNDKLSGEFKCFFPSGNISRIEHYDNNRNFDTTTYFNENEEVIKTVEYLTPCEFGSRTCKQFVTILKNGSKV